MKSLSYGLSLISLALVFSTTNSRLLDIQGFVDTIRDHCYNVTSDGKLWTAGQLVPLANSIENFISLVEKLERTPNSKYDIETIIEKLTAWFTINDLEIIETSSVKKIYRQNGRHPMITRTDDKLINNFLLTKDDFDSLNEAFQVYSENEVCSLYYMLSHTVNSTDANRECFTHGKRSMRRLRQVPPENDQVVPPRNGDNNQNLAKCSLEQGVVSVNSEEDDAVAISRVLFGIYAGVRNLRHVDPMDMKRPPNEPEDLKADPLPAFTVGALMGRAVLMGETPDHTVRTRIGHTGIWNSTQCTTEFELESIPTGVTSAEAKGAVDGLILGTALREMRKQSGSLPSLSQILRMYYKKHRHSSIPSAIPHYCDRQNQLELALKKQEVERDMEDMAKIFYWHATGTYPAGKTDYRDNWNDARGEFDLFRNNDLRPGKACEMLEVTTKTVCDTPSNVFMVLDERASMEEQRKLAADLANRLDLDEFRGSISILTNKFSDGMSMGNISWNATSSGCPGCRAMWYSDEFGSKIQDDGDLLNIINRTLGDLERPRLDQATVGSKVLLYLKYGDQLGTDSKVNNALNRLREYHRDLTILGGLGVEGGRRFLSKITRDSKTDVKALGETEQTLTDLKQAICEVPALLQYKECRNGDGKQTYEGFVVPDTIQYWAMYPQYFLKSFDIRFYFRSEKGTIEVCHSRSTRHPEKRSKDNCNTFKEGGEPKEVEFRIRNPCEGKNVNNCAPFYFSVRGVASGDESRQNTCFEPRCKTSDAIRFTIRHEGVKCSGALKLLASPLQLLGTLLAIFYFLNKKN